ncbi:hypothetical protein DPMN_118844 [Dreissena polymorpha]|uniref:Uncharacterized protein n=1 Tax=Dreissena polymorpha TaxID=45954 RepID=A0A9D4JM48_DREPO|nr:hypothetical protein DPMN_118844 [Dreissena polymorpha]
MRAGQHLKKGCGTLKNISLEHLGNYVDFKWCLEVLQRVGVYGSRTRWWTFHLEPCGDE